MRVHSRAKGIVVLSIALAACSERGRAPIPIGSALVLGLDGEEPNLSLTVDVEQELSGQGTVLLDSVTATVTKGGVQTTFDDPDVSENHPVDLGERFQGSYRFRLTIDNPIPDWDRLEGSCARAGRTITVDATFYSDRNDQSQADDPPLFLLSTTVPLVSPIFPEPSNAFAMSSTWQLGITDAGVIGDVYEVSTGASEGVLISALTADGWSVYRQAEGASDAIVYQGFDFEERPAATDLSDATSVYGGRTYGGPLPGLRIQSGLQALDLALQAPAQDPEYPSAHLAGLSPSANGVYAIVQTSFAVPDGEGGALSPPVDKYYGSFLLELAPDMSITSVEASDRDLLFVAADADGSVLRVSGELPPRTGGIGVRVERRDSTGQVVWSHDEPANTFHASARSLPDGGAIVAFASELPSGSIVVLRLDASGAPVYRYTALGRDPSIAAGDDGSALVAFSGVEPSLPELPSRQVPLLVELSAAGVPVGGQQLACDGRGVIARTPGGRRVLAAELDELADLGGAISEAAYGRLIVLDVD